MIARATPSAIAQRGGVDSSRGWVVAIAGFITCFTTFGVAYSFGAFFDAVGRDFHAGRAATAALFSITTALYYALSPLTGRLTDRLGPRPVLIVGAFVMGGGLYITSRATTIVVGYAAYGIGVGVGVACGYVPMLGVVGGWFRQKLSAALGFTVAGIGVGTACASQVAARLLAPHGWRWTYERFAILSTGLMLIAALLAKRPPKRASNMRPLLVRVVARTATFRWLYISAFAVSLGLFIPIVMLPTYATQHGIPRIRAASLLGILAALSIVGRVALALLGDRVGRVRLYQSSVLLMAVSYVLWLIAGSSFPWLIAYCVIFGLAYGGFIALLPAVVAESFGAGNLGAILGTLYTAAGLGGLLGPPIAGAIVDHTGSFTMAIVGTLGTALAGYAALLRVKTRRPDLRMTLGS